MPIRLLLCGRTLRTSCLSRVLLVFKLSWWIMEILLMCITSVVGKWSRKQLRSMACHEASISSMVRKWWSENKRGASAPLLFLKPLHAHRIWNKQRGGRITASLLQPTYERITKNTLTFELWKLLFLRRYDFCFFMLSKRYCRGVTPTNL